VPWQAGDRHARPLGDSDPGPEAGFNSHGQWARQNNFILDGVDNNSHILGLQDRKAQVLVPNIDAVQEFQFTRATTMPNSEAAPAR
jgi:hypothetical protein